MLLTHPPYPPHRTIIQSCELCSLHTKPPRPRARKWPRPVPTCALCQICTCQVNVSGTGLAGHGQQVASPESCNQLLSRVCQPLHNALKRSLMFDRCHCTVSVTSLDVSLRKCSPVQAFFRALDWTWGTG